MKTSSLHPLITAALSLIVTVGAVSSLLYIGVTVFYVLDPTCEGFIGEYETWKCSFGEYSQSTLIRIITLVGIPFLSVCLYPFAWVAINAIYAYRASHNKTLFPEMRKKFFRLGFSCVVSLIVSFIIITFYNSYLIDTLHLIEGGIFSSLIFLIWPLSYYGVYRLITNKVAKIK